MNKGRKLVLLAVLSYKLKLAGKMFFQAIARPNQSLRATLHQDEAGQFQAKPLNPKTDCFMADINATLMQDIINLTKIQEIAHIIHNRQADNFW